MNRLLGIGLLMAGAALAACSSATSTSPQTTIRSALNPPTGLTSLTGDGQMILTWNAANTESDFGGYNIYVIKGAVAALGTAGYPVGAVIDPVAGGTDSIPYCNTNTAIFQTFGMPAAAADCTGASPAGVDTKTGNLALDGSTTNPPPTGFVTCAENTTGGNVSLPAKRPILGPMTCTVAKDSAGGLIADGTTYSVFATSVAGSSQGNLSWTSNFIQDTPGKILFPAITGTNGAYSIGSANAVLTPGNVYMFAASNLTTAPPTAYTAFPTAQACSGFPTVSGTTKGNVCTVLNTNQETTAGIYLGLSGATISSAYPYRVFLSVPKSGSISILPRGPQITFDSTGKVTAPGLPGDHAVSEPTAGAIYDTAGTLYAIYGDQVFDFKVKNAAGTFTYGKIVISGTPTVDTTTGNVTMSVAIVIQPTAGVTDYFTGNAL